MADPTPVKRPASVDSDESSFDFSLSRETIGIEEFLRLVNDADLYAVTRFHGHLTVILKDRPLIDEPVLSDFLRTLNAANSNVPLERVQSLHDSLRSDPTKQEDANYLLKVFSETGSAAVKEFTSQTAKNLKLDLTKVNPPSDLRSEKVQSKLHAYNDGVVFAESGSSFLASTALATNPAQFSKPLTPVFFDETTKPAQAYAQGLAHASESIAHAKQVEQVHSAHFHHALEAIGNAVALSSDSSTLAIEAIVASVGEVSFAQMSILRTYESAAIAALEQRKFNRLVGPPADMYASLAV